MEEEEYNYGTDLCIVGGDFWSWRHHVAPWRYPGGATGVWGAAHAERSPAHWRQRSRLVDQATRQTCLTRWVHHLRLTRLCAITLNFVLNGFWRDVNYDSSKMNLTLITILVFSLVNTTVT